MSLEAHKNLLFILGFARRVDSQSKHVAQKLNENRCVYHAHAVLDALNSSFSMFKYFLDVFFSNTDPNFANDMLISREGMVILGSEIIFLVPLALLASLFNKKNSGQTKEHWAQRFFVDAWYYLRDVMKGLRSGYKGWRSVVQTLSTIGKANLKWLISPFGFLLGIVAALIRISLRRINKNRQKQKAHNELLLKTQLARLLQNKYSEQRFFKEHVVPTIAFQSKIQCAGLFLAVAIDGFVDGSYYLLGVISLSVLVPPLFIAMAVVSAIYILAHIISRLYDEYQAQIELRITKIQCELAFLIEEMEQSYSKWRSAHDRQNPEQRQLLSEKWSKCIKKATRLQHLLTHQKHSGYLTAGLRGMKIGLGTYSVVATILFMVVSVFLSVAIPPAFLVAGILSGFVFMAISSVIFLVAHYQSQKKKGLNELLLDDLSVLKMLQNIEPNHEERVKKSLGSMKELLQRSSKAFLWTSYENGMEVVRSFASGTQKGNSFFNFMTTVLHVDFSEHDIGTPIKTILGMISVLVFAAVYAFKAFARGFGFKKDKAQGSDDKKSVGGHQPKKDLGESKSEKSECVDSPRHDKKNDSSYSVVNHRARLFSSSSPSVIPVLDDVPEVVGLA